MAWVLLGVVVVVLAWVVATYNGLVTLRNKAEEGWSGIDVQLRRRADLVPNLVEAVRGYASHEEGVFGRVAEARAALVAASDPEAAEAADQQLTSAVKSLFAVAEAYPDLQASENFLELQRQLAAVEEELAFSRRYYNATVEDLNTRVEQFPSNVVAGAFGFQRRPYFEAGADAASAPQVDLGR